jgi:hypothetical protein
MKSLIAFLKSMPPGAITDSTNLQKILGKCWLEFAGCDSEGMHADRLALMQEVQWSPPLLKFTLRLFGGSVKGSLRAEVQRWIVDVEKKTAGADCSAYPQPVEKSPPFYVNPVADELAQSIIQGDQNRWLMWSANGNVQILHGRILHGGNQKTLEGRLRRLNKALELRLTPKGWKRRGTWWGQNL